MAKSFRNSANRSESCRRSAWLLAFLAIALLANSGAAADDWIRLSLTDTVPARSIGPAQPTRLPPVDTVSYDAATTDTRRPIQDLGQLPASGTSDYFEASAFESDASETSFSESTLQPVSAWFDYVHVGYDSGFVIAGDSDLDLQTSEMPFVLRLNGWGQLRHTVFDSHGANPDLNQFQLKRGRISFSGTAFTSNFAYFVQLDGRSSSGDDLRLLDYFLKFDLGRHWFGLERGVFGFRTGKYKVPFTMSRELSGREFEFADRSMSSMFFDVNRSLAWGLYGRLNCRCLPLHWEIAIFNGLVTGGAETGSSGALDNNFAYSGRVHAFPTGDWGLGALADFDWHETLATRVGAAVANSTIERSGTTEFGSLRVVDSGDRLSNLLVGPFAADQYSVNLYALDASFKLHGWSGTLEYYFRSIHGFQGANVPDLSDHGFWLQLGKFIVPEKLQLITRWSRVVGNSGTLGVNNQSAEEIAGGFVWYFRDQHAKIVFDATHLDGAPISSSALDIAPGDLGWLFRTQIQFAF